MDENFEEPLENELGYEDIILDKVLNLFDISM